MTDGETILLVEDEPAILEVSTIMLEEMGYAVIAAGSPGEAIRMVREHHGRIDLLMTDVVMPELNARDLAGNLISGACSCRATRPMSSPTTLTEPRRFLPSKTLLDKRLGHQNQGSAGS